MLKNKIFTLASIFLVCLSLSACASNKHTTNESYNEQVIADPIEPLNRAVFGFNNIVDIAVFEPAAKVYVFVVPEPIRNSIQNFMRNLRSPIIVANNLLQADFGDAGVGTARFVINTTAGIGGLFDVADHYAGLKYENEDFGQTLAVWGLGDGFYIVLPLIGPSSLRDGIGLTVDTFMDPMYIMAQNDANNEWIYYTKVGVEALDMRSRYINEIDDLRKNSLDFYAAMRSIYSQKRHALIHEGNMNQSYDMPDYDDDE